MCVFDHLVGYWDQLEISANTETGPNPAFPKEASRMGGDVVQWPVCSSAMLKTPSLMSNIKQTRHGSCPSPQEEEKVEDKNSKWSSLAT